MGRPPPRPPGWPSLDIVNLGGLNARLGEPAADKVFKTLTAIVRDEIEPLGGHVNLFRHGGDEISAVVLGVDEGALTQALERARAKAGAYVAGQGPG